MNEIFEELRHDSDMKDHEYRHAFAEVHLNSMIAMQIKVLREQRNLSQAALGDLSAMAQPRISVLEDVNYSAWSINTLKRLAKAFDLRLRVSFEDFGSLESDLGVQGSASFERVSFSEDPEFHRQGLEESQEYAAKSAGAPSAGTSGAPEAVPHLSVAVGSGKEPVLQEFQQTGEITFLADSVTQNEPHGGSSKSSLWGKETGTDGAILHAR